MRGRGKAERRRNGETERRDKRSRERERGRDLSLSSLALFLVSQLHGWCRAVHLPEYVRRVCCGRSEFRVSGLKSRGMPWPDQPWALHFKVDQKFSVETIALYFSCQGPLNTLRTFGSPPPPPTYQRYAGPPESRCAGLRRGGAHCLASEQLAGRGGLGFRV